MKRPAPPLTQRTGDFWRSGADGVLRIAHCQACGYYLHPPRGTCPRCRKSDVRFDPVSGKGVVYSFSINRYQWNPDMPPPYVLAEVDLVEQPELRLLTNIVGCAPEDVRIGMEVSVTFEQSGEAWIPVFKA